MCGEEDVRLVKAKIDQSVLTVCKECASFGEVISRPASSSGSSSSSTGSSGSTASGSGSSGSGKPKRRRDPLEETAEEVLKEDYGKIIQRAREKRDWTQEDLGKEIAEKVSVIKELEGQEMTPPDSLVQKLERTLDVELMEEVEPVDLDAGSSSSSGEGMTLGDLIKRESDD